MNVVFFSNIVLIKVQLAFNDLMISVSSCSTSKWIWISEKISSRRNISPWTGWSSSLGSRMAWWRSTLSRWSICWVSWRWAAGSLSLWTSWLSLRWSSLTWWSVIWMTWRRSLILSRPSWITGRSSLTRWSTRSLWTLSLCHGCCPFVIHILSF